MIIEEVTENHRTTAESKSRVHDHVHIEYAVNFLLRSRHSGIFYSVGSTAYLIPMQRTLGYKRSHIRVN